MVRFVQLSEPWLGVSVHPGVAQRSCFFGQDVPSSKDALATPWLEPDIKTPLWLWNCRRGVSCRQSHAFTYFGTEVALKPKTSLPILGRENVSLESNDVLREQLEQAASDEGQDS
mmetsp:Transcript_68692/g.135919  ORF Transcript_68692/g.135919 Transcript_68692/m.135919 type:complete len:115 (+) Transcript_68692:28-372(+)